MVYTFEFTFEQIAEAMTTKLNLSETTVAKIIEIFGNDMIIFGSFIMSIVAKDDFKINDLDIMVPLGKKDSIIRQLSNWFTLDNTMNYDDGISLYNKIKIIKETECYRIPNSDIILHISYYQYTMYDTSIHYAFNNSNWFKFSKVWYQSNNIYHTINREYYENKNIIIEGDINKFVNGFQFIYKYQSEKGFVLIPNNKFYSMNNKNNASLHDLKHFKKLYKSKGLVVIPLSNHDQSREGKAPAVRDWQNKDNTFDFQLERTHNIGIICGENSGIVCIDVDAKDDGVKYFNQLIQKYGLPTCPTQTTPNGGFHYIFKYDHDRMRNMQLKIKGVNLNDRRIGIDFWIQKCQFVCEPSINKLNGKSYKWIVSLESCDIPALPEWIYDLYNNEEIDENCNIIINDITYESDNLIEDVKVSKSFISRLCGCFK